MTRVLCVDDSRHMRMMIEAVLPKEYEFFWAYHGGEALEYMSTMDFDVVLLDLVMPEMDGIETLEKLAERKNKVPVLLITGVSDPEKLEEASMLGIADFVLKPFDPDFLAEKVAFLIENKGYRIEEGMGEYDGKFLKVNKDPEELEAEDTDAGAAKPGGGRKLQVRTFDPEDEVGGVELKPKAAPPVVAGGGEREYKPQDQGEILDESFGFFVVQQVSEPSRLYELDKTVVKVGRGRGSDLFLNDESVSRLHCLLKKSGYEVTIKDCDSSNGTIVNGHDIKEEVLKHDDQVRLGRFFLTFKTYNAEVMGDIKYYEAFKRHRPQEPKSDDTTQLMQAGSVDSFIEQFSLEHHMMLVSMDYAEEAYQVQRDKFELGSEEMPCPDLKGGTGVFIEWIDDAHWLTRRRMGAKEVSINGDAVRKAKLEPGDVIEIGEVSFAYQYRKDADG